METTVPPSSTPAEPPESAAPPQTPADIPGLGPIRVRALQKAGLGTLDALRAARFEDLCAVPGMSEIKARSILDYLARFPADAEADAKPAKPPKKTATPARSRRPARQAQAPPEPIAKAAPPEQDDETLISATMLITEATQVAQQVATLLTGPRAWQFRPRLVRALTHCTPVIETLRGSSEELSAKARVRAVRQLRRVLSDLADLMAHPDLDRKAQARIADSLAAASDKLART